MLTGLGNLLGKAREGHHKRAETAVSLSQVFMHMLKTLNRYRDSVRQGTISRISGYGLIVKNMASAAIHSGFESQVLYLVVVRTRESY